MKTTFSLQLCLAALWISLSPAQAKLNVVVTTPDLAAVVREVGGSQVDITTLARATEDPHFVDARPSFIAKLNKADALVEGGAELEAGWLAPLLEGARNPKVATGAPGRIACQEGVKLLEVPATLDRSKGDIHASGNPHYMMDPLNAKIVAGHIATAFCQIDAASCEAYRANLGKFNATLDAKLVEWRQTLAPFKGRRVVCYHDSWVYFAERFELKMDLFLEPKPGIPPTPAHLAGVIARIKSEKVGVILVEPFLNRKTAETVARNSGAALVDATQFPGGVKGTEGGTVALFDYLTQSLARSLAAGSK